MAKKGLKQYIESIVVQVKRGLKLNLKCFKLDQKCFKKVLYWTKNSSKSRYKLD